jgi:adenosylcobyric acid synthase
MGDLVAAHLDTAAVSRLITGGPPSGLPVIPPAGAMPPQARANTPQAGQS